MTEENEKKRLGSFVVVASIVSALVLVICVPYIIGYNVRVKNEVIESHAAMKALFLIKKDVVH